MSEVIELHRPVPAVEVRDLRKEFSRRDKKAGRFARKKRAALAGRHVHDGARRVRRDPGPERLGQVDPGPAAVDAALQRRRQRARSSATTSSPTRARCASSSTASRSRPASSRRCRPARTCTTRRASTGWAPRETRVKIPAILDEGRLPGRPAQRADGEPLARDAAEGRARAGAPDLAGAAPARRADDGARPALEARGAGLRPRGAGDARRDDPALHARPRRGGGAGGPRRHPRPRRAALPRDRAGDPERASASRRSSRRSSPRPAASSRRRRTRRTTRRGRCSHERRCIDTAAPS